MTRPSNRRLSKALLLKGLQFPRAPWLSKPPPYLAFPEDPVRDARYAAGSAVVYEASYPGGTGGDSPMKRAQAVIYVLLLLSALAGAGTARAEDATVYPTLPGTSLRDYSRPGYVIEDDSAYPTLPGTGIKDYSKPGATFDDGNVYPTLPGTSIRDYSRPGYRIKDDEIQPTLPGTGIRDYSRPGYKIEGDMVYPTLPGTGIRDYSRPGFRIEGD